MSQPPAARRGEVPDAVVWVLLGLIVVLPLLSWLSAQISTLVTAGHSAHIGLDDATRAVPRLVAAPGEPARAYEPAGRDLPGPVGYWSVAALLVASFSAGVIVVAAGTLRRQGRPGMARRGELRHMAGRAVAGRAAVLRPDLPSEVDQATAVAAAGVALGRHHPSGLPVFGTVEDSFLVIAPPRTGKTTRVVIPAVLDHQGPAVVTSTRWEAVEITAGARAERGPVWVFDADQSTERMPAMMETAAWSPVAGCEFPQAAMIRARSLARAAGAGAGMDAGQFWASHAQTVLQSYLHAAALGGRTIADVRRWALDATNREAVTILRSSKAAPGWAGDLSAQTMVSDRQRDGVWGVVQQSLAALSDPALLKLCSPADDDGFDPDELLALNGTLYLVGRSETQDVVAPLVAALVEAITSTARARAARRTGGRLAPPLLVALDEAANIAPLPTLPTLVADGGGSGITTMVVLQSRARARERWGEDAAEAIVAACTHRLVLGGGGELRELDDLARLVGERDEEIRSHSWSPWGADSRGASTSTSLRRVPIITPADLQALPKGRGVLCSPNTPPAEIALPAWWDRHDADQLRSNGSPRIDSHLERGDTK